MNKVNSDNALLLAIAALSRCHVSGVTLAGFDGFRTGLTDFYDSKYVFAGNGDYYLLTNESTAEGINNLSKMIKIKFLTKSLYESTSGEE